MIALILLSFCVGGVIGYVVAMMVVLHALLRTTRKLIAENNQSMDGVAQALLQVLTKLSIQTDVQKEESPVEVPLR